MRKAQLKTLLGENLIVSPAIKRAVVLDYLQKGLKNKKKLLQKKIFDVKNQKSARLKKRRIHQTTRRLKETFSKFKRHKKRELRELGLWQLRKQYRAEGTSRRRLKKRLNYRKPLRQLTVKTVSKLLTKITEERSKIASKKMQPTAILTPLHFKKPISFSTASVEENKK